ncbi:MAG: translation initiation factor [Vulcanimicrobiaceae bacterium]
MPPDDRRLVYSTDGSLPLPKLQRAPRAAAKRVAHPEDGVVRVAFERRRGGAVTIVHGLREGELVAVAAELKRRCGTGGSVKDGLVVLQGDRREAALAYFAALGRRAKRMGG